jgi:hypothetical protein
MVTNNNNSSSNANRSHYYTEVGIKIHQFRISVRFPASSLKLGSASPTKDDSDWKWIPQRTELAATSLDVVSWCPDGSPAMAPPVPPRSGSPTNPPPSALPPYPSSTVSRRHRTLEAKRPPRICSYV